MAAGTDGQEACEEGHGKTSELVVQEPKGGWSGGKGPSWIVQKYFNSGKGGQGANRAGKGQWSKTGCKKGGTGQEKGGKGDTIVCWYCGENRRQGSWNRSLNAVDEDNGDIREEVRENEDELHAWCLLEESEIEPWQEVSSKISTLKLKKLMRHCRVLKTILARLQERSSKSKTVG